MLNQIKTMQINVNMRHLTLEVKQLQATSAATTAIQQHQMRLCCTCNTQKKKKQEPNQSCLLQLVKFKQQQQQQPQQKLMMNFIIRFANVQQHRRCAVGVAAGVALNEGRPRQRSARIERWATLSAMHDERQSRGNSNKNNTK